MKPTLHLPASGLIAPMLCMVVDGFAAAARSEEIS
jgi:hypothetical protein